MKNKLNCTARPHQNIELIINKKIFYDQLYKINKKCKNK